LSDDTPITPGSSENRRFVEYMDRDDEKEKYENTKFRKVEIAGKDYRVDMKVIEPYKKVLSHGGMWFSGYNLKADSRSRLTPMIYKPGELCDKLTIDAYKPYNLSFLISIKIHLK